MLKELLELLYIYLRKDIEPSVGRKAAVGDKAMKMRVKIDEIANGLDGDHNSTNSFLLV